MLNTVKKIGITLISLTSITMLNAFAAPALPAPQNSLQPINKVLAVVNKAAITQNEFDMTLKQAKQTIAKRHMSTPPEAQLKQIVLNQLIYKELQLQIAKKYGISASEAEVNGAIQNVLKQNHFTLAELKAKLAKEDISYSMFRQQIKTQITISMVQRQAVASKIMINNNDIEKFLRKYKSEMSASVEYNVTDVLVALPSSPSKAQLAAAKAAASKIANAIRSGKSAAIAAKSNKDATANVMGWQTAAQLPKLFTQHLTTMKAGDVSSPILAANGYHVIKLLDTSSSTGNTPTKATASKILFQQKFQKALQKWLVDLRKSSYVKVY